MPTVLSLERYTGGFPPPLMLLDSSPEKCTVSQHLNLILTVYVSINICIAGRKLFLQRQAKLYIPTCIHYCKYNWFFFQMENFPVRVSIQNIYKY